MAKIASVNVDCAANGGAEAIWNLIDLLVNGGGGWSIVAQSDASGGNITHAGTGAGGLNNPSAYVVIQEPAGGQDRRYFFQRSSSANDYQWWIRYMRSNVAIAGGTNTVMPFPSPNTTGTIENLVGTGAVGAQLFNTDGVSGSPGTRNYRTHAVAFTTPTSDAFFFGMFCTIKITGAISGTVFACPMTSAIVGDQDPIIIACESGLGAMQLAGGQRKSYLRYGLSGQLWRDGNSFANASGSGAVNLWTGDDDVIEPVFYDSPTGSFRGKTSLILQSGIARSYPNTINLNTNAYAYTISSTTGIIMPWPNGVEPVL
jgi:hypothetical protein